MMPTEERSVVLNTINCLWLRQGLKGRIMKSQAQRIGCAIVAKGGRQTDPGVGPHACVGGGAR